MGTWGMGTPVEIEFAVNLASPQGSAEGIRPAADAPARDPTRAEALTIDVARSLPAPLLQPAGAGERRHPRHPRHRRGRRPHVRPVDEPGCRHAKSAHFNEQPVEEAPLPACRRRALGIARPVARHPHPLGQILPAPGRLWKRGSRISMSRPLRGRTSSRTSRRSWSGTSPSTAVRTGFLDWDWLLGQPALEAAQFTRLVRLEPH